jgi:hypothetical protein
MVLYPEFWYLFLNEASPCYSVVLAVDHRVNHNTLLFHNPLARE